MKTPAPSPQTDKPAKGGGDAATGHVDGFDRPVHQLLFAPRGARLAGGTPRRQRWRGAHLVDHQHPLEGFLFWMALWLGFLTLALLGAALDPGAARDASGLACLASLVALTALFGGLYMNTDIFLLADPAEPVLAEVLAIGDRVIRLRSWDPSEVQALRLRSWKGYQRLPRKGYLWWQRRDFHLRALEVVPRQGTPRLLTYAEAAGEENRAAAMALAHGVKVAFEETPTEQLGFCWSRPAQPLWGGPGSATLVLLGGSAVLGFLAASL